MAYKGNILEKKPKQNRISVELFQKNKKFMSISAFKLVT